MRQSLTRACATRTVSGTTGEQRRQERVQRHELTGLRSLTSSCANNGQTTWTYNQGVIASGLAQLAIATGDSSLFDQAEITLDATIQLKTENGILKETCDSATPTSTCDNDQAMFKGIWMKHLQYYLTSTKSAHFDRVAKYTRFIEAQSKAVSRFATNKTTLAIGSVWYAENAVG